MTIKKPSTRVKSVDRMNIYDLLVYISVEDWYLNSHKFIDSGRFEFQGSKWRLIE